MFLTNQHIKAYYMTLKFVGKIYILVVYLWITNHLTLSDIIQPPFYYAHGFHGSGIQKGNREDGLSVSCLGPQLGSPEKLGMIQRAGDRTTELSDIRVQ